MNNRAFIVAVLCGTLLGGAAGLVVNYLTSGNLWATGVTAFVVGAAVPMLLGE